MILRRFSAALFLCLFTILPLSAGAEGDPNGEAPQAARTVRLPLGSVDVVSGALDMRIPLGPRMPGRIPLGFSWSYNSQDGGNQAVGGCIRPVVWPGAVISPIQVTVMVGGEPWVFYKQASPAARPTDAQLLQWAQDRGVQMVLRDTPPTVTMYPASDGTKFYVEVDVPGSYPIPGKVYWMVLSEDSAIWTGGKAGDPTVGSITHFTNRWGDAVTVTESNWFNGWSGVPGTIVIRNDNRTAQTITMTISGTPQYYIDTPNTAGALNPSSMRITSASLLVDNTLVGNDNIKLPKVQVSGAVYGLERAPSGSIYDEGLLPLSITVTPQDGTPGLTTGFGWTQVPLTGGGYGNAPPLVSATLPSGLVETFTAFSPVNFYAYNRSVDWDATTGLWIGINRPPPQYTPLNPDSDITWDAPVAVQQVTLTVPGTSDPGKCYKFARLWPNIPAHVPSTITDQPHFSEVLIYPTANPGSGDSFRGFRFTHPNSWPTMIGDTSTRAYLFATSAILAEETIHGTGLPTPDQSGEYTVVPSATTTTDQVTVYDGWSLRSWANPSGVLSTTNGIPVTAVALRSQTWTPSTGLLGPLPDKITLAGSPDAWGPTVTDEYENPPSTPPTVSGESVGLWSDAVTAPSYTTHRRGTITRSWNDSGLMRLLAKTSVKNLDDASGTKLRYATPGLNAAPPSGLSTVNFGTTTSTYDAQGRVTSEDGKRNAFDALETRAYTATMTAANGTGYPQPLLTDTMKSLTLNGTVVPANPAQPSVVVGKTYTYSDPLVQSGPSTVLDKVDGRTETFAYDGMGRVTSHTDVLGITTTTAYDAWGHVKTVTRQAKGGVASMTTTYAHDPAGLWKTETVTEGDSGRSLTTRTDLDAFGRVVKVTGPDGSTQTFGYTGFGERNSASPVLKPGQTSWGNETWAYDAIGRETDHWDAQGRLLQHVVQQPAWTTVSGIAGIWTTTQDDRGYTRSEGHDLLGQKLGIVDQAGNLSRYWYDQDGHLLETQQGSQYRSYTYNDMGWLTSRTEPEEGSTLYGVGTNGFNMFGTSLVTVQRGRSGARSNTFATTLDAHLQPIQITATGPEGPVTRSLTYDGATHLLTGVSETQANGTLTESYPVATAYDGIYRLVGKTISDGTQSFSVSQALDAAGRQQTLTYPNAAGRADQTVTGYDSLGRSVTVTLNGETKASGAMVYDQISGTAVTNTLTLGNNAWTTSKVDKGELTHVTHTAAAGVLEDDAITWTAGGLMLSRGADTFGYDALQRLNASHVRNLATGAFVDQGFSYDRSGNRTTTTTSAPTGTLANDSEALTWTASYGSGNDLPTTVTGTSGTLNTGALYDDLGRLSQAWTTPGQVSTLTTWTYDPSGRVMAENGTSYLLDSAGLRFKRTKADGSITYTVYGFGREPLKVFTKAPAGSLAWSKTVVYGFGQELREDQAGTSVSTIYLQSDQVGSPNYTTDGTGALVNSSKNLPFGERMLDASASAPKSIRRFTNHEEDPDSNAIYMQAREYLAAYGKFAEVDPAYDQTKDDPESWNLYNYVTNNPVTHTDPDGRMPVPLNQAEWNKANNEKVDGDWLSMAYAVFQPIKDTAQSELWLVSMATKAEAAGTAPLPSARSNATGGENGAAHTEAPKAQTGGISASVTVTQLDVVNGGKGDYNATYTLTQSTSTFSFSLTDGFQVSSSGQHSIVQGDMKTTPDSPNVGAPTANGTLSWTNTVHHANSQYGGFPTVAVTTLSGSGKLTTSDPNPTHGGANWQDAIHIHPPMPNTSSGPWNKPPVSLSGEHRKPFSTGCWVVRPDEHGRTLIDSMRSSASRGDVRIIDLNTSSN
jgi:RHS repeat-associated protein